jgi:protein-S-isoprenylcysteine O-methyltransferase Ste14
VASADRYRALRPHTPPLILGLFTFLVGIALWLESYASVLALPLFFVFVIVRIFIEEKTLQETLPGYVEYMSKVRYRLIPFVW